MRIRDVLNSNECKNIFSEVEKFVELSLSEYNEAIEKDGFNFSDKDIFDFVWGTVNFSAAEICILDSPLLQRLRRIRQLGLASTVYCNADSSRFSHTIGVTEVADRMARVITQKLNIAQNEVYDVEEIVRLAAIFHDVGHMFFSHVSELYFSYDVSFPRYREITNAKNYFCEKTSSDVSLHELISVMVVNSKETIRLIENVAPHMKKSRVNRKEQYKQMMEYVSCLIIGTPIDRFILPYSAIINSSIDADKLDYLSRDSACTKVPIAVDIARIIQKLDVVNIREIKYPQIWNDSMSPNSDLKIMAIKSSARKVFWQLSNARSSMYESVYYHHKVLTAETMFRKALQKFYSAQDASQINFTEILKLTDDVFSEYWDIILLTPEKRSTSEANEIRKILKCVRDRNLYKRVAAFSRTSLTAPLSNVGKFFRNVIQNPLSEEYQKFCELMKEEYTRICRLLDDESNSETFEDEPVFMFIYSNYDAMASMPVESEDGFCIWSSSLMKQETMEAGKKSKQEQFYLVTDCKERDKVYLALEKVITKFGIDRLAKESSMCSKVSSDKLNSMRMMLLEKGYYKDTMYLLQDDIFFRFIDRKMFDEVIKKYQSFQGVNACQITEKTLTNYLRQFLMLELDKDELVTLLDGILRILKEAYYIDRETFKRHATELISNMPYQKKYFTTLGGDFDSSKHLLYFFNDIKDKEYIFFDSVIENALKNLGEEKRLIFFDDGAYSGKQVISIFQELMGIPIEERTTNEHHVDELSEENKKRLRECKVVLAYLCFNSQSESYIKEELKKIGICDVEIKYTRELSSKVFGHENIWFVDDKQKELVSKYLRKIGIDILMSSKRLDTGEFKPRWNEKRIKEAALGYNDAQQMVVFSSNIPTYSITSFWANGKFHNKQWTGLFQRTDKD